MRRFWIFPVAVTTLAVASVAVVAGDKETPDDSMPRVAALVFRAEKNKASTELAAVVAKVRTTCEDKDVLFLDVNVTSRGTRHQAKLLLNALGLGAAWRAHAKLPGRVVLVDVDSGEVLKVMAAKDGDTAIVEAITEALGSADEPEEDEEGIDDDMK